MRGIIFSVIVFASLSLLYPMSASAQLKSCPTGGKGIDTAIGCIPIETDQSIAEFFLRWGMGIGVGVAFILIVYSGIIIITATGDPRKLQAGKETLTAAITGLVLLIFSAFVLRVIGVNILGIGGF